MKLSAVLKVASLTLPAVALFPAMAFADDASFASLASAGGSSVRASLSANGLLGPLSPIEGAVVTGLVVFALGCVVAVLVARKLDRTELAGVAGVAKEDADALFAPRAVSPLYSYQPPTAFARAEATARIDSSRQLPAPAPSSPRLPGASSRRVLVADDAEPEPTLTAWPPRETGEVSGERPIAQNDNRSVERSGVVPSAHARPAMGSMGARSTGIVVDAEVVYEPSPGADPDATTQFVRGRNLSLVTAHTPSTATETATETPRMRTVLPPAIRPIPISAPRANASPTAIAGANVSDLSFDDSPTEIGLPSFEEVEREISKASEIRSLSGHGVTDPNETQAFLLLKSS